MPPPEGTADERAIAAAKRTLRSAIRFRRDTRDPERRRRDDGARLAVLQEALRTRSPGTVAAYLSAGSEPGTLQLVAWLATQGARVLLPVLTDPSGAIRREPTWAEYAGPDALRAGAYGIVEPSTAALPAGQLSGVELFLIPGLAADRRGDRLGRGGGWYDRALGHAAPAAPVWVLLNDDEVLDTVPVHEWDRPVDALATPAGLIHREPGPPHP